MNVLHYQLSYAYSTSLFLFSNSRNIIVQVYCTENLQISKLINIFLQGIHIYDCSVLSHMSYGGSLILNELFNSSMYNLLNKNKLYC